MKAAKTNSAFDGQRRYTVALLARAVVATASTVKRSYPCSCSSRNVTVSSSISRGDHGVDSGARSAISVTMPTIELLCGTAHHHTDYDWPMAGISGSALLPIDFDEG